VGKGVAVEVTKDYTLQMLRGSDNSQNLKELRKVFETSDTLKLSYNEYTMSNLSWETGQN